MGRRRSADRAGSPWLLVPLAGTIGLSGTDSRLSHTSGKAGSEHPSPPEGRPGRTAPTVRPGQRHKAESEGGTGALHQESLHVRVRNHQA